MPIPLPKLRELKEAVIALIKGPYTSKFPAEPPVIADAFRGFPDYHKDDCIGCGACKNVCPPGAIDMQDNLATNTRKLTLCIDRCIMCGQCQANCPTQKGIMLGHEYDLTTTNRADLRQRIVEKPLVICEACDEIISTKDHILWIAKRLGPLAYSNPTLMLASLQREPSLPRKPEADFDKGLRRGDKVRILCPRCRQEVSFLA